ncbi:putative protease Axl1p [Monosporozyma unispora]|nr:hypothetical protein C6P44_003002 [Kazachstania unispora]
MSNWSKIENYDIQFQLPFSYCNRSHKLCRLPNGLLTLLVSDPTDTSSVCSVTVATGSHNDPKGIPGIAHLCEHMLFAAGSKAYADPNLYHTILAKNNGSHNAYTTGEQSTFYFELPNMHQDGEMEFNSVLDIFASFFKDPLFSTVALNKEMYAIQSEHDGNVSNIDKILYQATRILSDENHPFHQFSTGNIHSLNSVGGSNAKSVLMKYFNENFCAKNMTLVIKGPQSVNILTKLAMAKFGDIRTNSITRSRSTFGSIKRLPSMKSNYSKSDNPTKIEKSKLLTNMWGKKYGTTNCFNLEDDNIIFINSKKQSTIRFLFPVSSKNSKFSTKQINVFSSVWCELFGDESSGSLCFNFRRTGWINECIAYKSTFATDEIGLVIELSLTTTGLTHVRDIVYELFENMLETFTKKYTDKISMFLYEHAIIEYINYLYKSKESSSLDFCSDLSECLQSNLSDLNIEFFFKMSPNLIELDTVDFENLLGVNEWWLKQAVLFKNFLIEFINTSNAKIIFLGSDVSKFSLILLSNEKPNFETDFYYEFEYLKTKVSLKKLIKQYQQDHLTLESSCTFYPPQSNNFIPSHIVNISSLQQLFMECSLKSRFATLQPQFMTKLNEKMKPRLVNKSMFYEMWVCDMNQDGTVSQVDNNKDLNGKSIITFEILSLNLSPSVENTIHLEIFAEVLDLLLTYKLYPALKLGYSYEIVTSMEGQVRIGFTVSGFNDGIFTILNEIIDMINLINDINNVKVPSKETLRTARVTVRSKYTEASSEISVKLATMGLLIVMERNMWTLEDRLDALENSDMLKFKLFVNSFIGEYQKMTQLTLLVQSNETHICDEINFMLHNKLTHHLNMSRCGTPIETSIISTIRLPNGTNDYVEYPSHESDSNNSIVYFIQTGTRKDSYIYTLTAFTEYIMSLTLVPDLRYNKQIGYVVLGGMRILTDMVGVHITVMSSSEPDTLEDKINEYLWYLETVILGAMTPLKFKKEYITPYIRLLEQKGSDSIEETMGGPQNLMEEIPPNIMHGGNEIVQGQGMKRHRQFLNQINRKDYDFFRGHDLINLEVINDLRWREYMKFFREFISVRSPRRSKVSIWISSPLDSEEIMNKNMFLQIETFLKMKGLTIKPDDLKEIVAKSKGSPGKLLKLLIKHFSSRGETWKLCSVIAKELGQSLSQSFQIRGNKSSSTPTSSSSSSSLPFTKPALATPLHKLNSPNSYRELL